MNLTPTKSRALSSWAATILLILPLCFALAGCGGQGGDGPIIPPLGNFAPASMNGHTLTFVDPDQPQFQTSYVFSTSTYTSPSGDSGTYTWAQSTTLNQGLLHLMSSFSPALTYNLTYTTSTNGTYVNQVNATGTFSMQ